MKNGITSTLLTLSCLLSMCLPAIADDANPATTGEGSGTATNVQGSNESSASKSTANKSTLTDNLGHAVVKAPEAAVSLVVATVVGTPIAMVRYSADEVTHAAKGE